MSNNVLLEEFIKQVLLDEAKKKKKRKVRKKKVSSKKAKSKTKKRPGRKEYYRNINKKGQKAMAKEINKCSPAGKPKGWKTPKSCYDKEWEADEKK